MKPTEAPAPALDLEGYEILRRIGSRRQPAYVARRDGGPRSALFVVEPFVAVEETAEQRADFVRDAQRIATLRSTGLPRVQEVIARLHDDVVVGEYVDGEKLSEVWPSTAPDTDESSAPMLPLGVALRVLGDLLAALDALHRLRDAKGQPLGIVHGEVSPYTTLLGQDGVGRVLYAIARRAPGAHVEPSSARYVAPELLCPTPQATPPAAAGRLDPRSDVYSVGVLLWEALSGQPLLLETEPDEIAARVAAGLPPATGPADPAEWAKGLRDVAARALACKPDERFASAPAMAAEIRRHALAGMKMTALPAAASFMAAKAGARIRSRRAGLEAESRRPSIAAPPTESESSAAPAAAASAATVVAPSIAPAPSPASSPPRPLVVPTPGHRAAPPLPRPLVVATPRPPAPHPVPTELERPVRPLVMATPAGPPLRVPTPRPEPPPAAAPARASTPPAVEPRPLSLPPGDLVLEEEDTKADRALPEPEPPQPPRPREPVLVAPAVAAEPVRVDPGERPPPPEPAAQASEDTDPSMYRTSVRNARAAAVRRTMMASLCAVSLVVAFVVGWNLLHGHGRAPSSTQSAAGTAAPQGATAPSAIAVTATPAPPAAPPAATTPTPTTPPEPPASAEPVAAATAPEPSAVASVPPEPPTAAPDPPRPPATVVATTRSRPAPAAQATAKPRRPHKPTSKPVYDPGGI